MYTRNYRQIREDSKQKNNDAAAGAPTDARDDAGSGDVGIVWEAKNENEIPAGYRGTAMLRPSDESPDGHAEDPQNNADTADISDEVEALSMKRIPRQPLRRARPPRKRPEPEEPPKQECQINDRRRIRSPEPERIPYQDKDYGHAEEHDFVDGCECGKDRKDSCRYENDRREDKCDKPECEEKTRPGLFGRELKLEDLLLGGLILLLLNEGSDDIIIIILGLLLISGF